MNKKVAVIGSGPGGLTGAMILANNGYEVELFEKKPYIGGRNSSIEMDGFTFDLGSTFLMMKHVVAEIFELAGRKMEDYLDVVEIDPMYRLVFGDDRVFYPSRDHEKTAKQIEELFPGNADGYRRFFEHEKIKYDRLVPCLKVPYGSFGKMFTKRLLRALPYIDAHRSLYSVLSKYFDHKDLRISFTFQAKYLGMSPWDCPGAFAIISYIEHADGIWHTIGGLNQITKSMAKVLEEHGGKIHLDTPVKQVIVENGVAKGVELENGEKISADYVLVNADFGHAVNTLFPRNALRKWAPEKLRKKRFSCSTFMLYLGVDKIYDLPHHNVLFADDYFQNVKEIATTRVLSDDPSIYVQNASVTDPKLAPEGKSTIYILVPTANLRGNIDWEVEKQKLRDKVIALTEKRGGFTDLGKHIVAEKCITPVDWQEDKDVYLGATFNLAHNVAQMLVFRPHNRFEDIRNCYLAGGGTHPGSGLPTIIESGRISAEDIINRDRR